jgi:spore coat polysaccharide biosynthesis protein SpsF
MIRAFVQARMSSQRFPGKVLSPFKGKPIIRHVIDAIQGSLPGVPVVVVTSDQESDDPIVNYLESTGGKVFRGPLKNVFRRFRECAVEYPCDWILRVSADSPMVNTVVLQTIARKSEDTDGDLVTTIFPRTFPKGHNAELIRVSTFMEIIPDKLTGHDKEHVTSFYYRHPEEFKIVNLESGDSRLARDNLAVDTVEDLIRLEQMQDMEYEKYSYKSLLTIWT